MVVGTTAYRDTKEAYPLDKKTLRMIALRSIFTEAGKNAETGSSIGFTWAIAPGLKKIHTDEEDLKIALGQNLEYQDTGIFTTLVMGIVLSLEAQKADPAVIRSVRTSLSISLKSLERSLINYVLVTLLFALLGTSMISGNVLPAVIFAGVLFLLNIVLRFALIGVGYAKGSAAAEKLIRSSDKLKHASRIAGIFMAGALIACARSFEGITIGSSLNLYAGTIEFTSLAVSMIPGALGLATTMMVYYLLTKKNKSILQCVLAVVVLAAVVSALVLI